MQKNDNSYIQYAKSIFQIAKEENKIELFYDNLCLICSSLTHDDILIFFTDNFIPISDKIALIQKTYSASCERKVVNFICILCENNIITLIYDITKHYLKLCDENENRAHVVVTAAYEVKDKEAIVCAVSKIIKNKNMRLEFHVDASLIGGIKIEVDDTLYDYSIKHQIDNIRNIFEKIDMTSQNRRI